jgi:hypothetical protein
MAEIKIVRKKQVGLWLLAGIALAILLYYFLVFRENSNNNAVEVVTETKSVSDTNDNNLLGVKENNSTVAAFVIFVENEPTRISFDYAIEISLGNKCYGWRNWL